MKKTNDKLFVIILFLIILNIYLGVVVNVKIDSQNNVYPFFPNIITAITEMGFVYPAIIAILATLINLFPYKEHSYPKRYLRRWLFLLLFMNIIFSLFFAGIWSFHLYERTFVL